MVLADEGGIRVGGGEGAGGDGDGGSGRFGCGGRSGRAICAGLLGLCCRPRDVVEELVLALKAFGVKLLRERLLSATRSKPKEPKTLTLMMSLPSSSAGEVKASASINSFALFLAISDSAMMSRCGA